MSRASTAGESSEALLDRLVAAREAARRLVGREPLGLRAVEAAPGRLHYVCAFDGPAFLVLTGSLEAERDAARAREAASAGLLWEHVEAAVDSEGLEELARAIGAVLAAGAEPREMADALQTVAARAIDLAAWRAEPERVVARVEAVDDAIAIQERLVGAYRRFMRASEPLVEAQDTLPDDLVAALRRVEEAAASAGAGERLAERLAAAMPECDHGAGQMVDAHLTPLS